MTSELEKRLGEVLEEMEEASDEELASEVEAYRESLKDYEFEGPGLGSIALQATSPVGDQLEEPSGSVEMDTGSETEWNLDDIRRFLVGLHELGEAFRTSIHVGLTALVKAFDVDSEEPVEPESITIVRREQFVVSSDDIESDDLDQRAYDDMVA